MNENINIAGILKDAPKNRLQGVLDGAPKDLDGEVWKPIPKYEELYAVSNYGRIKRVGGFVNRYGEHLIHQFRVGEYMSVGLSKDGIRVQRRVHRLVSLAFVPNPNNCPCINHKDENKLNNHADNLEWCTAKYNINYGNGIRKASIARKNDPNRSKPVEALDESGKIVLVFPSLKEAGRNGYNIQLISEACRGKQRTKCKTYKHLYWRFKQ